MHILAIFCRYLEQNLPFKTAFENNPRPLSLGADLYYYAVDNHFTSDGIHYKVHHKLRGLEEGHRCSC